MFQDPWMEMMKKTLTKALCLIFLFNISAFGNSASGFIHPDNKLVPKNSDMVRKVLLGEFKKNLSGPEVIRLKKQTLTYSGKAIPALIQVMKSDTYPDKNRWVATFLVGRIMGKKSSPFLAKFLKHPNWVMRMASLKTLLALKEKSYSVAYAKALKDRSLIVRKQALENIRKLGLNDKGAEVWSMLYDKRNYYNPKDGQKKRTNLIREAIKTVGDLKFEKAKTPLLSMAQKDKYEDVFSEIDYSLSKITGKKSPDDTNLKKRFWKKMAISNQTI
ncbi:MAG: HEAT repeat domain-containing protein [Bacteriovoracaceae bacterium]|nr:HEAT repeat domain-containing protein [Bacteriovoracaceae bacterium]